MLATDSKVVGARGARVVVVDVLEVGAGNVVVVVVVVDVVATVPKVVATADDENRPPLPVVQADNTPTTTRSATPVASLRTLASTVDITYLVFGATDRSPEERRCRGKPAIRNSVVPGYGRNEETPR